MDPDEEIDKEVLRIHGWVSTSEEDSDDESRDKFDAFYKKYKPPPILIDPEKDRIIVINPTPKANIVPKFLSYANAVKNLPEPVELPENGDNMLSKSPIIKRKRKKKKKNPEKDRIIVINPTPKGNIVPKFLSDANAVKNIREPVELPQNGDNKLSKSPIIKRKRKKKKKRKKHDNPSKMSNESCDNSSGIYENDKASDNIKNEEIIRNDSSSNIDICQKGDESSLLKQDFKMVEEIKEPETVQTNVLSLDSLEEYKCEILSKSQRRKLRRHRAKEKTTENTNSDSSFEKNANVDGIDRNEKKDEPHSTSLSKESVAVPRTLKSRRARKKKTNHHPQSSSMEITTVTSQELHCNNNVNNKLSKLCAPTIYPRENNLSRLFTKFLWYLFIAVDENRFPVLQLLRHFYKCTISITPLEKYQQKRVWYSLVFIHKVVFQYQNYVRFYRKKIENGEDASKIDYAFLCAFISLARKAFTWLFRYDDQFRVTIGYQSSEYGYIVENLQYMLIVIIDKLKYDFEALVKGVNLNNPEVVNYDSDVNSIESETCSDFDASEDKINSTNDHLCLSSLKFGDKGNIEYSTHLVSRIQLQKSVLADLRNDNASSDFIQNDCQLLHSIEDLPKRDNFFLHKDIVPFRSPDLNYVYDSIQNVEFQQPITENLPFENLSSNVVEVQFSQAQYLKRLAIEELGQSDSSRFNNIIEENVLCLIPSRKDNLRQLTSSETVSSLIEYPLVWIKNCCGFRSVVLLILFLITFKQIIVPFVLYFSVAILIFLLSYVELFFFIALLLYLCIFFIVKY